MLCPPRKQYGLAGLNLLTGSAAYQRTVINTCTSPHERGYRIFLLVFNIPNVLVRWLGLDLGYSQGSSFIERLEKSGQVKLVTHCAGIIGAVSIGTMIAMWVSISCPLEFTLSEMTITIQEYLNQITPKLLPLVCTLAVYGCIKRGAKVAMIIVGIVVIGFILGVTGLIAM